jgi:hypothetical protein
MKNKKNEFADKKVITEKSLMRQGLRNQYIKPAMKTSLTPEKFKMYVTEIFLFDDLKTKLFNMCRSSISNNIIKYDALYPEICKLRRTENKTEGNKKKIAKLIKEALVRELNLTFEKYGDDTRVKINATKEEILTGKIKDVENYVYDLAKVESDKDMPTQFLELVIEDRVKDVEKYMKDNLPVYQWCNEIRGLGAKLAAKLLAGIVDIQRFPNPASLWSYCGVGDAEKSKRKTGQKLSHSPKMRSTLYNLEESFIKAGSQYRVIYDKRKEATIKTHPEWHNLKPCPVKNVGEHAPKTNEKGKVIWDNMHPKHAHIDAARVMIKRFLAELFVAWYQSLGQEPPAKPYGVEIQGHHEDPMIVPYVGKLHIIEISDFHVGEEDDYDVIDTV